MMKITCTLLTVLIVNSMLTAQHRTPVKIYPEGMPVGDAVLYEQWFESDGRQSSVVYVVDIKTAAHYLVKANANMQQGAYQWVTDNGRATHLRLTAQRSGWQQAAAGIRGNTNAGVFFTAGRHTLRFTTTGNMPPLNDGISLSRSGTHTKLDAHWQTFDTRLQQWVKERPVNTAPGNKHTASSKVLPNPKGDYDHAMDTAFSYSTFHYVTLTAGVTYTFTTTGSTKDPVLHLFDQTAVDTRSWWNDDGIAMGYESSLTVTIPFTQTYCLLARPYHASQSGVTTIKQNGVTILSNTPIGGQRFNTTARTGSLNFFTCRLNGASNPDTRIFTLSNAGGYVSGYNDDYIPNGGDWFWGRSSRIKKNFAPNSNTVVYICAYGTGNTGSCDVYMGNQNSTFYFADGGGKFPNMKPDDAIAAAPADSYNCIAWSGGLTTYMIWPPTEYSTWAVPGNALASFDNYYSNNPPRYPGAWNYTRTGATSANSVVDLWKLPNGGAYTHASVTKPGNNHPHGYDWESKPGATTRTFHPRYALNNPEWYGYVNNWYIPTGSYAPARMTGRHFETAEDAVKAGAAVYETARLTAPAQEKLTGMMAAADKALLQRFNDLYTAWQKTRAANATMSNPDLFCENEEYRALEKMCTSNARAAMPLVFDRFVNGNDHYIGKLLLTLTRGRYIHLLQEVKDEAIKNPYDAEGRYKIPGDHNNGVRYVEKILRQMEASPAMIQTAPMITVTTSPNPVKEVLTVTLEVKEDSRIGINAVSAHTRIAKQILAETRLAAGTYQYRLLVTGFAGAAGDIITVQTMVNGVLQTAKVMVQ